MTLQTLIKFIIGTIIIIFIFWVRFIHQREAVVLNQISLNYFQISIRIIMILLFSFILYINLKKVFYYNTSSRILQNKYIKHLLDLIKEYITNAPEFLYRKLTINNDYDLIFDKLAYGLTFYNPKNIIIILLIIPQIIIANIFIIDIFYFGELHYFFISLNLLIIILLVRVLLFIIKTSSERRAYHMEQYLDIKKITDGGFNFSFKETFPSKQLFSLLPNKNKELFSAHISLIPPELQRKKQLPLVPIKETLVPLARIWFHYRVIYDNQLFYQELYEKYNSYVLVYTSLCYVIGWSNYLYLIFTSS